MHGFLGRVFLSVFLSVCLAVLPDRCIPTRTPWICAHILTLRSVLRGKSRESGTMGDRVPL